MPKKHVYLAGPIAGVSYDDATQWRDSVKRNFLPGIVGVSPMRMKEWLEGHEKIDNAYAWLLEEKPLEWHIGGSPSAIGTRDYHDVQNCDMLFAYLPRKYNEKRPSWGTSFEIGWAIALRKPVVLVTDDPSLSNHPLATTHIGFIVPDLAIGVEVVNAFFGAYL